MQTDVQTASPGDAARSSTSQNGSRYSDAALTPPVDVIEDSNGITLYADLPGVNRENLHLHVEAGTLTIEAESRLEIPEGLTSHHTEVGLARFRRVFTLSKELDTEKVSAELAQGVLKLRIPKAEHAQARRIEVQVAYTADRHPSAGEPLARRPKAFVPHAIRGIQDHRQERSHVGGSARQTARPSGSERARTSRSSNFISRSRCESKEPQER